MSGPGCFLETTAGLVFSTVILKFEFSLVMRVLFPRMAGLWAAFRVARVFRKVFRQGLLFSRWGAFALYRLRAKGVYLSRLLLNMVRYRRGAFNLL